MIGLKTINTVNGQQTTEVDGELAVQQIRIYTENPYTANGSIRLIYKVNTDTDGLLQSKDGGDKTIQIMDSDLVTKTFNGVSYTDLILAIKECAKYVIGRVPTESVEE